MNIRKLTEQLGVLTALLSLVACASDDTSTAAIPLADTTCTVSETLSGDISADKSFGQGACVGLSGYVKVNDGATLTFGAGSRIKASTSTTTALIIQQGGKLNAVGTSSAPIVFTVDTAAGNRTSGAWGGIVMQGKAPVKAGDGSSNSVSNTEINTGAYGGNDANDNSGSLQYARIEFSGVEYQSNKEFNGLFLAGVGKGTTISHVQVHKSSDDGVEIFGGTVDLSYIVISDCEDDGFDLDEGWNGTASNFVISQNASGDHMIEYSGCSTSSCTTADADRTNAVFSNFTMVGFKGQTKEGAIAMNTKGGLSLYNSYIAYDWGDYGIISEDAANSSVSKAFASNFVEMLYENVDFSTAESTNNVSQLACTGQSKPASCSSLGTLSSIFGTANSNNNVTNLDGSASAKITVPASWGAAWGATTGYSEFTGSYNASSGMTLADPPAAPNGTDLAQPAYVGAFSSTSDNWMSGWTDYPGN